MLKSEGCQFKIESEDENLACGIFCVCDGGACVGESSPPTFLPGAKTSTKNFAGRALPSI